MKKKGFLVLLIITAGFLTYHTVERNAGLHLGVTKSLAVGPPVGDHPVLHRFVCTNSAQGHWWTDFVEVGFSINKEDNGDITVGPVIVSGTNTAPQPALASFPSLSSSSFVSPILRATYKLGEDFESCCLLTITEGYDLFLHGDDSVGDGTDENPDLTLSAIDIDSAIETTVDDKTAATQVRVATAISNGFGDLEPTDICNFVMSYEVIMDADLTNNDGTPDDERLEVTHVGI